MLCAFELTIRAATWKKATKTFTNGVSGPNLEFLI